MSGNFSPIRLRRALFVDYFDKKIFLNLIKNDGARVQILKKP